MIGEKGVNLSGGQRARVSVARALYSEAQIYLFDDPLSAVDANVARNLFENCFNKYLKSKINILVTHQVHMLTNVNKIIYLVDGEIKMQASFADMMKSGINMDMMEKEKSESKEMVKNDINEIIIKSDENINQTMELSVVNKFLDSTSINSTILKSEDKSKYDPALINNNGILDDKEKKQSGALLWKNYFIYFKVGGGFFGCIFNFIIFISAQVLVVLADYWVSNWSSLEDIDMLTKLKYKSNSTNCSNCIDETNQNNIQIELFKDRYYYYKIYCILSGSALIIGALRAFIFYKLCINSSKYLHKAMFQSIMSTRTRFFDLNPIGRIMNRFSKDIGVIDEMIPITVFDVRNFIWHKLNFYVLFFWFVQQYNLFNFLFIIKKH